MTIRQTSNGFWYIENHSLDSPVFLHEDLIWRPAVWAINTTGLYETKEKAEQTLHKARLRDAKNRIIC